MAGPCYDPDAGGMICRTGSRWLRSSTLFVSLGNVEVGEMDGVTEGSIIAEYFNWCAPIGKLS